MKPRSRFTPAGIDGDNDLNLIDRGGFQALFDYP
jgi:hypothetical protein